MKKTALQKRMLAFVLALLITLGVVPFSAKAADEKITIYHTNDIHGNVEHIVDEEGKEVKQLGLDRVAQLKKNTENALLVDAGDFSQGHMFANLAHGKSVIEVMNTAGYDVAALGNHEFDFSISELDENIGTADFDVLAANISVGDKTKERYANLAEMPLYSVKEVGGKTIAFFAVDTPELNGMVSPKKLKEAGIAIRTDISKVATEIVASIQKDFPNVDAIIAITHTGYVDGAGDGKESAEQVAMVKGVSAVIDGHDHQLRLGDTAKNVNGTLVVSTGTAMTALGKLELTFSGGSVKAVSSNAFDEAKDLEPDSKTAAVIESWNQKFDETKSKVVFSSEVNLWGGNLDGYTMNNEEIKASIARRGETNAGTLMNDARIWKAKEWLKDNYDDGLYADFKLSPDMPVVCVTGGGSVRGSAKAGEITLEQLMGVFSFAFENAEDRYVMITPKTLYDAVEHGCTIFSGQDAASGMLEADGSIHGRFPLPGGFSYEYDISQPKSEEYDKDNMKMPAKIGSRVRSITLADGRVLDREDTKMQILLVTGSYEIGGGDSYWMLGVLNDAANYGGYMNIPLVATPEGNCGDAVIDYVNTVFNGVLPAKNYPVRGELIKRVNDPYKLDSFEAKLTVTDNGSELKNSEFILYVNGESKAVKSDAKGLITVELQNGPNELRLIGTKTKYDSGSIYLDNYAGLHNAVFDNKPGELPLNISSISRVEVADATVERTIEDFEEAA